MERSDATVTLATAAVGKPHSLPQLVFIDHPTPQAALRWGDDPAGTPP
jgi:hypothetical protein